MIRYGIQFGNLYRSIPADHIPSLLPAVGSQVQECRAHYLELRFLCFRRTGLRLPDVVLFLCQLSVRLLISKREKGDRASKMILTIAVILNISVLGVFKNVGFL